MPEIQPDTIRKINLKLVAIVAGVALITFLTIRYSWIVGFAILHENDIKVMQSYQSAAYQHKLGN